ncbi:hypothetical protein ADK92_30515 [Streptomyces sp. XY533]|nr:hypothetical protein ADK92_30515 [Streptomyces sp. XY533]
MDLPNMRLRDYPDRTQLYIRLIQDISDHVACLRHDCVTHGFRSIEDRELRLSIKIHCKGYALSFSQNFSSRRQRATQVNEAHCGDMLDHISLAPASRCGAHMLLNARPLIVSRFLTLHPRSGSPPCLVDDRRGRLRCSTGELVQMLPTA